MKYYFLINPTAGGKNKADVETYIKDVCTNNKLDFEIYYTKAKRDATKFVVDHKDEDCCVFACGGDGTVYDVVNGAVNTNVKIGVYPCGSGNDFARYFKDAKDLDTVLKQESIKVDTLKVNDVYSINVVNLGFDAAVNGSVDRFKKKFSITTAYNLSIISNIIKKMNKKYKIVIDGEVLEEGMFLLMSLGNASYYGGGYKCAPNAILDDGLLEFCAVRKISRFTLPKLINVYKKGEHLTNKKMAKYFVYKQCKCVEVISEEEFDVTVDGENFKTKNLKVTVEPKSVNLVCNK